ncbi:MAG: DUF4012 domain-containing protein [Anaerolineae bacterium]|nr:DUF4012 domain-containing protein [Anaerolineae bacterium]
MSDLQQDQTPPETLGMNVRSEELRHRRRRHRTPWQRLKRRLRHTNWIGVALVGLAVLAVLVVGALVLVTNAQNNVTDAWQSLDRVMSTLNRTPSNEWTLNDFDRLQASTSELAGALAGAQRQTGFLRPLAGAFPEGETTFAVLDVAQEVVQAARYVFNGMEPTFFFLAGGQAEESVNVQVASGERVVELLTLGRGQFVDAQRSLDAAAEGLAGLSGVQITVSWLDTIEQIGRFHEQLNEMNAILLNGPELLTQALGLTGARNYLVLSQNSDELRPAGGYISTYGWMEVRNARITDYDYSATTARTPIPPRAVPEDEAPDVPAWWIQYANPIYAAWDGSWSPDFPTTAEMAAWYYDAGGNTHSPVDGVIAIDMIGFEYILQGLGTVIVPGYEEIITPQNFRQVVYAIRAEETDNAHKEYLAAVYNAILDDWQNVDRERGAELFGATLRALQEKHIMLYFRDNTPLNSAVATLGWGGVQAPAVEHDYIMAVDANLGSKSNRSILRQLIYDVAIQHNGRLQSRLTVAYDFPEAVAALDPAVAPEHYNNIDYDNLLQVFVPAGSTLVETNNLTFEPEIVESGTHTEFVTQTLVEYNSGERFQFGYTTPALVEPFGPYYRYRLLLQKQPGMLGEAASVQVRLPNGTRMVSTSPAVEASYDLGEQVLEFRVDLVSDQWIEVIYRELDR